MRDKDDKAIDNKDEQKKEDNAMPRGDRTGPMGAGSMTGRGAGFCTGYDAPGFTNDVRGRGFGTGIGRGRSFFGCGAGSGRGWRNTFFATGLPGRARFGTTQADPEMQKKTLQSKSEVLQSELDLVKKRLQEMETKTASE